MARFLSDAWFRELVERIEASEAYREAAADWEGDVAFWIEAEPDRGLEEDVFAVLDLWHGRCLGGGLVERSRAEAARYLIAAPYSRWKDVVTGHLDPVRGMMQGKLRVRGDLPTIVRQVRAANELVRLTGEIPTEFPDEG
ncbi:MAG: Fis family transcriptional regulator [Actinomycetota bacterium]|nr:MAG: Fis family transcriptional regulator [Actinomycetota bacterium]